MEVSISNTTLIYPSESQFTNDHYLPLSALDTDPNFDFTFRYVRAYVSTPETSSLDPVHVISSALSRTLVHYYPLAGTIQPQPPHQRLSLFCAVGKGVPLICATANCTLESIHYLDDPTSPLTERLVYDPNTDPVRVNPDVEKGKAKEDPGSGRISTGVETGRANPFVLQVTVFACGGYTLGASIHHALGDGVGMTLLFSAMGELARGADRITIEPIWDRAGLLGPRDPPRVEVGLGKVFSLDDGSADKWKESDDTVFIRECFEIKNECLEKLKSALTENAGMSFTAFEALGAYIWRARVKASGVPGDEKVKFAYPMNIRKLVKPPLPIGFWGNGCVPIYVQLNAKDLVEKPIWETAEQIKKSKRDGNEEYVRSFIDFQAINYGKGITAGKRVSGFTDWRHLGHSTVDFGWGGPVTVLPLSRHLLGSVESCFFLPYSSAIAGKHDGFKVLVTLAEAAMPAFREEMEKFSGKEFGLA